MLHLELRQVEVEDRSGRGILLNARLDEGAEVVVPSHHRDTFLFAHTQSSLAVGQGKYYHRSIFIKAS